MAIKSKNWKETEDTTLVRAWMSIAQDPMTGNEQRADRFCERIHNEFYVHLLRAFTDVRKVDACKNRWQLLQKAVNKFCGCWSSIQRRNERGATVTQKLADAHTLYLRDRERPFKHIACWELLKDCQKWKSLIIEPSKDNRKRNRALHGDENAARATNDRSIADTDPQNTTRSRATGRHNAKNQARQVVLDSSIAESLAATARTSTKLSSIAEQKILALEKLAESQRLAANNHIMPTSLEDLDECARQYFELQKRRILREFLAQEQEYANQRADLGSVTLDNDTEDDDVVCADEKAELVDDAHADDSLE